MLKKIYKTISIILLALLFISSVYPSVYAEEPVGDPAKDTGVGVGGDVHSGGGRTWDETKSGYRITLANNKLERVSNKVHEFMKFDVCSRSKPHRSSVIVSIPQKVFHNA